MRIKDIDAFTKAYVECMIWSSQSDDEHSVSSEHTIDDLSEEALQQVVDDCKDFQESNAGLMVGLDAEQCGHDFWLTRNGHGAGFWDRGYPRDIGKALTESSKPYGECYPMVGDDGLIYLG
jgi:hypothetical protein